MCSRLFSASYPNTCASVHALRCVALRCVHTLVIVTLRRIFVRRDMREAQKPHRAFVRHAWLDGVPLISTEVVLNTGMSAPSLTF